MVLMVQTLMIQTESHQPIIIHHQVQVIISSSIIRSSPLSRVRGLQYLQSQTLLILLTLKGGLIHPMLTLAISF